jgi:nucleotide-binding universal stress UspA family protein
VREFLRGGAVFKRILVPIDLSDRNTRTIDVALELARQNRALVTLCHVIQSVRNVPSAELRKFYKRLEATSAGTLARVAKRFTAREVPVDTVVCIGEPAREIVRLAAGRRIDLIVMGSHKVRAGRWATGWGTSSYKVGIFCRCPVLLVK